MTQSKSSKVIFHLLTWFVILTQITTSAAFADLKILSKATLAPQYIDQLNPPDKKAAGETALSMEIAAVLDYIGRSHFVESYPVEYVKIITRNEFRNTQPWLDAVDLDSLSLSGGVLTVWYNDPDDGRRHQARIFPRDHGTSEDFGISFRSEPTDPVTERTEPPDGSGPLIGHGFSKRDLDKVDIVSWKDSKPFEDLLAKFETTVLPRAPSYMRKRLLETLKLFKEGADGRRMGLASSVCRDKEHYYLGFGTSRSIGIGHEFLDPSNPLSEHALETLFHELYHATFGKPSDNEDIEDSAVVHYEAIKAAALLFWGMSRDEADEMVGLRTLKLCKNNKFGEVVRNWKSDRIWADTKGRISGAITSGDQSFLIDTLSYLLRSPEYNSGKVIELLTIWDGIYRASNGNKSDVQGLIKQVTGALNKEKKYKFANLICSPAYHTLYHANHIIQSILDESKNDIAQQILELKIKEVAGRIKRNPAYLWDREMRSIREMALDTLSHPEGVTKERIHELETLYDLYRDGGLDPRRLKRAQELKDSFNLKPGEVIGYGSMEYATTEDLLFFAGGLGALAGDHAKAGSDLLPAGTFVCVGGYYKFGYLNQVIDSNRYQQANYERMKIEEWGEIAKNADDKDIVISLPMPDGNTIYAKAWKMEMGRTDLYLMTTDIDENNANPYYKGYLNYTYDADDERRIVQEYVIGVGGERMLNALGMKTKVLHLNEGHVAFTILEKARGLLMEKIELLNAQTGLGYKIENLERIPIEDRRKYGLTLEQALDAVRRMVVFTSHTPVAAGNQTFPVRIAERYIGNYLKTFGGQFGDIGFEPNIHDGRFDMTEFALTFSNRFNGVARKHAEVCRKMYAAGNAKIQEQLKRERPEAINVTNAVNREYYQPEEMQELLGQKLAALQEAGSIAKEVTLDNISWIDMWKVADSITDVEMEDISKRMLENGIRELKAVRNQGAVEGSRILPAEFDIDPNALILTFGRRITGYKRPDYILEKDGDLDIEAWRAVVKEAKSRGKKAQIIYTGKAHPADDASKSTLQKILHIAMFDEDLKGTILFIENYNTQIAKALVKIASATLNNPIPPEEASGTSGMKYEIAGKVNLSVMDGWTLEAGKDGSLWGVYPFVTRSEFKDIVCGDWRFVNRAGESVAGPGIGKRVLTHEQEVRDGRKIFECLDPACRHVWAVGADDPNPSVCPKCGRPAIKNNSYKELGLMDIFFDHRSRWCQMMRESLAMGMSYFTSHRMFKEYIEKMYLPTIEASEKAKKDFMAIGLEPNAQVQSTVGDATKDLSGKYTAGADRAIKNLIGNDEVVELAVEKGELKAYKIIYVLGYGFRRPGPGKYLGSPVNINTLFTKEEQRNIKSWISWPWIKGSKVRLRVAVNSSALGWGEDIDHTLVAHAGYRDGAIYMGLGLLKKIFQKGNEALRDEVLKKDELRHLKGELHGSKEEYAARLKLVWAALKDAAAIESEMAEIHEMNAGLLPSVEKDKVLYEVIEEELIPVTMISEMHSLARETENLKLRERIKIVKRKDLQSETARLKSDPNNIILAAVQRKYDLKVLPEGVKALVFTGTDGGAFGFKQLEGIIAALRALERGDAAAITRLYRILTGTKFAGKIDDLSRYMTDPQALADVISFSLDPSQAKDPAELKHLNRLLTVFLHEA